MQTINAEFFEVVRDSGLTQKELAELCNVTRATVVYWMNGKKVPLNNNANVLRSVVEKVSELVDKRALPVSPRLRGVHRKNKIFELIQDNVT